MKTLKKQFKFILSVAFAIYAVYALSSCTKKNDDPVPVVKNEKPKDDTNNGGGGNNNTLSVAEKWEKFDSLKTLDSNFVMVKVTKLSDGVTNEFPDGYYVGNYNITNNIQRVKILDKYDISYDINNEFHPFIIQNNKSNNQNIVNKSFNLENKSFIIIMNGIDYELVIKGLK